MKTIIGIDLGTTNSEVALVENGTVVILTDENKQQIIPSVVSIDKNNQLLIGTIAKNQQVLYPERTISSIKRLMGEQEQISLGDDNLYTPPEISAMILKKLKTMAENYTGKKIEHAVITVPAYFSDKQRQATQQAGTIAGLEVLRIINEPTAAALAYDCCDEQEKKILVYDLGGGTFDVSIVSVSRQAIEVLSSHGNNHLGGDDFDAKIVDFLVETLQQKHQFDARQDLKVITRLRHTAEKAKIHLSDHPYYQIQEEYLFEQDGAPIHLSLEFSRQQYEEMIENLITETFDAIHTTLDNAKLSANDIDEILLVGGSTRTPLIRGRLQQEFNREPRAEIHPDLCVAAGAAIQAARINGDKTGKVLVDVTPYTFGTSAVGEIDGEISMSLFCPVIHKNTPLPVTKSQSFYKMNSHQKAIEVTVYQGEEKDAENNTLIGDFLFDQLSTKEKSEEVIAKFQLDVNGVLHVTVEEKSTKASRSIIIDDVLNEELTSSIAEAQQKINQLFDDTDSPTTAEKPLEQQANQSMAQAKKILESVDDQDKVDLIDCIESLNDSLLSNDPAAIEEAQIELDDLLHYLDLSIA